VAWACTIPANATGENTLLFLRPSEREELVELINDAIMEEEAHPARNFSDLRRVIHAILLRR
jgi:hypothetical protein